MRKGFGLYAPHETTVFFVKAMLVSVWIGIDVVAGLLVARFSSGDLARYGWLLLFAFLVLLCGTVFSILFAWSTGALFGPDVRQTKKHGVGALLEQAKRSPHALLVLGASLVAAGTLLAIASLVFLRAGADAVTHAACVRPEIANRCVEVARLEGKLFQSDEQKVFEQCVAQYGSK